MGWMHFNNIIEFYLFFNSIEILKLTWVGEDLMRFGLHLPPQMLPQTKNGPRPKP